MHSNVGNFQAGQCCKNSELQSKNSGQKVFVALPDFQLISALSGSLFEKSCAKTLWFCYQAIILLFKKCYKRSGHDLSNITEN